MKLPAALVYRLGGTKFNPSKISTNVDIDIDAETESVVIRFASTDGNERNDSVAIILQKEDLVQLLQDTSRTLPRLADILANCAATATKGYFKLASGTLPMPVTKEPGWMVKLLQATCEKKS